MLHCRALFCATSTTQVENENFKNFAGTFSNLLSSFFLFFVQLLSFHLMDAEIRNIAVPLDNRAMAILTLKSSCSVL